MNSTEIVLKRVGDLKRLSVQLKQQTQNNSSVDVNLVKAILQTTKDVSPKKNEVSTQRPLNSQQSNNEIPIFKMLLSQKDQNHHKESKKSMNNESNYNYKPLFPENSNFPKRNNSVPPNQFIQDQQEEVINLREQNLLLERQMRQMQEEMQKYRDLSSSRQFQNNRSHKDMPFFQLSENVNNFYTKITISQKDYKKIDYTFGNVDLSLQKLIINNKKQFELVELNQVEYVDDNIILLQFFKEDEEQYIKLFLKFDDKETLHKWDLGIYINYKIISSLEQDQLFLQQLKDKKNIPPPKEVDLETEQKDILKSFLQKKQQYMVAQKHLKESMLEKIQESKSKKSLENSQVSSAKSKSKQKHTQLFEVFGEEKRQSNFFIEEEEEETQEQKRKREQQEIQRKQREERQQRQARQLQQKRKREQQEQRLRQQLLEKERREKQRIEEERRREEERKKQEELQRIEKQVEMNHIVDRLKYGYMLVKYAKSAYNPHDKKFYVSLDGKKLCWEDKDSNGKDVKSLKMDEILSVNLGDIGDGIEKHVGSKKKIPNLDCYGIVLSSNKERKSLEVGSKSPQVIRQFIINLQKYHQHLQ